MPRAVSRAALSAPVFVPFIAPAIAVACLASAFAHAAPQGPDRQGLHIDPDHTRHLHQHGEKHATSTEAGRFWTNRGSAIDLPLPSEEDAFFFVVYGDRTGGPAEGISVLKDAVRDTNLLEPDFVMTVGDLIQGYNQADAWMPQMEEYKGVMGELLCPWFPVAGNHDTYYRGPEELKPEGEHDANYEMYFGPLWYAFEHKNSMFIALYSDEGNPETGEKNFRKPESQRMSDEQFSWLKEMLEIGSEREHIFMFIHHPRWLGGGYGDDWNKVHDELVKAGNVSAVFAGHIHRMRYDPKDGIDYVTLATVGGGQSFTAPEAGWLHHFNVVTVRKDQVAHAAIPVGETIDVREITGDLADQAGLLARTRADVSPSVTMGMDGAGDTEVTVRLRNPASMDVDVTVVPESGDSRWVAWPDHDHGTIGAGETGEFTFRVTRQGDRLDSTFRPLEFVIDMEMLTPSHRYTIPTVRAEAPMDVDLIAPPRPATETVLGLGRSGAHAVVTSDKYVLPDGAMTLECWFRAESFSGRTGLVAKTENSEFGFFVSDGKPQFSIHLDGAYRTAGLSEPFLKTGAWQHIAGVYDGSEVRLYVDGTLVDSQPASGTRTLNQLPLVIGADVDRGGRPTSFFDGAIDEVRLSTVARYEGSAFRPSRRLTPDGETVLLFHMDGSVGRWMIDSSETGATATLGGGARIEPAE